MDDWLWEECFKGLLNRRDKLIQNVDRYDGAYADFWQPKLDDTNEALRRMQKLRAEMLTA